MTELNAKVVEGLDYYEKSHHYGFAFYTRMIPRKTVDAEAYHLHLGVLVLYLTNN